MPVTLLTFTNRPAVEFCRVCVLKLSHSNRSLYVSSPGCTLSLTAVLDTSTFAPRLTDTLRNEVDAAAILSQKSQVQMAINQHPGIQKLIWQFKPFGICNMRNSHSSTMFPFPSCFVELLHPVHGAFILRVTHHRESWHCTPCLYQSTDLGSRVGHVWVFFISSVLWPRERAKQCTLNLFLGLMLRWGRAGHFKKYFLHPVPESKWGRLLLKTDFKGRGSTRAGLFFLTWFGNAQKGCRKSIDQLINLVWPKLWLTRLHSIMLGQGLFDNLGDKTSGSRRTQNNRKTANTRKPFLLPPAVYFNCITWNG